MLLREIAYGKRFMFVSRVTPLAVFNAPGKQFTAQGTFKHIASGERGSVKLLHEESGKEVWVVGSTYYRPVLPIF